MSQPKPGTVLRDRYRIVRLIGQGAVGQVYEVEDTRLRQRYALKLLSNEATADREFLQRFRREAQVVSRLHHPHIVQVVDFAETEDGRPFLVMELLDGEDLSLRLDRDGPLPLPAVLTIVEQMASALQSAHALGIVHRDLKPENVLLVKAPPGTGAEDAAKLVDFGISKVKNASLRLTQKNAVIGTPHYMSPEQALCQEVDERADQFALAAITYELLSGEVAFGGDSVPAVVFQVTHGEPPRLADPSGWISLAVDAVLRQGLAKRPGDRFATVMDFARALRKAAGELPAEGFRRAQRPLAATTRRNVGVSNTPAPVAQTPPATRASGRRGPTLAAVAVAVAAAGAFWMATRDPQASALAGSRRAPTASAPAPTPVPAPAPLAAAPAPPRIATPAAPAQIRSAEPTPKPSRRAGARRRAPRPEDRLYNEL